MINSLNTGSDFFSRRPEVTCRIQTGVFLGVEPIDSLALIRPRSARRDPSSA
jgi:hypothetical protein